MLYELISNEGKTKLDDLIRIVVKEGFRITGCRERYPSKAGLERLREKGIDPSTMSKRHAITIQVKNESEFDRFRKRVNAETVKVYWHPLRGVA